MGPRERRGVRVVRRHPGHRAERLPGRGDHLGRRDGKYVAVASKGGADDNPEWFYNLVAHPEVDLQDKGEKHTYVARRLEGDERAEWWQYAVETWPTYGEYQKKTDRELPVFLLERA